MIQTMRKSVTKFAPSVLLASALLVIAAIPALALELVPGGYGAGPSGAASKAVVSGGQQVVVNEASDSSDLAMDFTPRDGTGLWARTGGAGDQSSDLRFDLSVDGARDASSTQLGFGASRDTLRAGRSGSAALAVGGAMHWSDWTVGGGLGRAQVMGTDIDLMSASLGYGRVTAGIAIGQSDAPAIGQPRDVLMLSTDLTAWSWLTLESNLAVGSPAGAEGDRDRDRDAVAAGRLGLRLNF